MHWKQRRPPLQAPAPRRTHEAVLRERQRRRHSTVVGLLRDLSDGGEPVSHALLAERSGLPLNWLRWAYPSLDQLAGNGTR